MRWRGLVCVAALAVSVVAVSGQEPQAPKLGVEPPPRPAQEQAPAQAVPVVVTICVDKTVKQCWTVSGASDCRSPSRPSAEAFATVGSGWPEAGKSLRTCWDTITK